MTCTLGTRLGLGVTANVSWFARRGVRWGQLLPAVWDFISTHPPQLLVLHLGENDLGLQSSISLRLQARSGLHRIQQWIPGTRILWSCMLPRRVWRSARSLVHVDRARRKLNVYMGRLAVMLGGFVIYHPKIRFSEPDLFWGEGVHLSVLGADIFLSDLQQGLEEAVWVGERDQALG